MGAPYSSTGVPLVKFMLSMMRWGSKHVQNHGFRIDQVRFHMDGTKNGAYKQYSSIFAPFLN